MSADRAPIVAVIVGAVDAETLDEALRGAVGLTLRGARVHVVLTDPTVSLGPSGERARAALALFGHRIDGRDGLDRAIAEAVAIEIWGPGPGPGLGASDARTFHLVRPGRVAAVAATDQVLHLGADLDDAGADQILDQLLAGRTIAVW